MCYNLDIGMLAFNDCGQRSYQCQSEIYLRWLIPLHLLDSREHHVDFVVLPWIIVEIDWGKKVPFVYTGMREKAWIACAKISFLQNMSSKTNSVVTCVEFHCVISKTLVVWDTK